MTRALLDVNVLIALLDVDHVHHETASAWLDDEIATGWASCAITENGFVRIVSQPRYPNAVAAAVAITTLEAATATAHHAFWDDSVSLLDADVVDRARIHGPRQITDAYLLALAVAHDGRFATFDRAVDLRAVHGARSEHLVVLP